MAALTAAMFTALVWLVIGLVLAVFIYEIYVIATDFGIR